jgi:iron complex outermembrane receptor protein
VSLGRDVAPEKVNAFEVGFKTVKGPFRFNTSAFYYDYKNLQVQVQTNVNNVVSVLLQNAATAEIYGLDADIEAQLSDDFTISGGAGYTHARYKDYPGALLTLPIFECVVGTVVTPGACTGQGTTFSAGNQQIAGSAAGKDLIRTPEFQANLTLAYSHEFPVGRIKASVTGSYNSGFSWDPADVVRQRAYTVLNANASWTSPDEHWTVGAWAKNLTNEKYAIYVTATETGTIGSFNRPFSAGVFVELNF